MFDLGLGIIWLQLGSPANLNWWTGFSTPKENRKKWCWSQILFLTSLLHWLWPSIDRWVNTLSISISMVVVGPLNWCFWILHAAWLSSLSLTQTPPKFDHYFYYHFISCQWPQHVPAQYCSSLLAMNIKL